MTSLGRIKYGVIGLVIGGVLVYFFNPSKTITKTEIEVVEVEKIVEVEKVVEKRIIERVTTTPDGTVIDEKITEDIDRTVDRTIDKDTKLTEKTKLTTINTDKRLLAMVYYDPLQEDFGFNLSYNLFGSISAGVFVSEGFSGVGIGVRF